MPKPRVWQRRDSEPGRVADLVQGLGARGHPDERTAGGCTRDRLAAQADAAVSAAVPVHRDRAARAIGRRRVRDAGTCRNDPARTPPGPRRLGAVLLRARRAAIASQLPWRPFRRCGTCLRSVARCGRERARCAPLPDAGRRTAHHARFARPKRPGAGRAAITGQCTKGLRIGNTSGVAGMMRKVLFLDRDGCLVVEPADEQLDSFEKFDLMPGVVAALQRCVAAGYELVMVTNQDGLGTPSFPLASFDGPQQLLLRVLGSQGVTFRDILIDGSFEHENRDTRKPRTGLLRTWLADDGWSRAASAVIGDRATDMELAANLGVRGLDRKSTRLNSSH